MIQLNHRTAFLLPLTTLSMCLFASTGLAQTTSTVDTNTTQAGDAQKIVSSPNIVNGNEPLTSDWRFDAVGAYGRTANLNGSNGDSSEHNTFGNGTLITPYTVVMARHLLSNSYSQTNPPPSELFTMRFRRNPDGSLGEKALGWESFHQVAISHFTFPDALNDVMIAHLSEPVMHIDPICVGNGEGLSAGDSIILSGWGKTGTVFDTGARGELLLAYSTVTNVAFGHVRFPSYWGGSPTCGCGVNNYDSGGGVFIEDTFAPVGEQPKIRLVGVVSTTSAAGIPSVHQLVDANTCSCPADINDDGSLDYFDVNGFLALYAANDPYADWNGDGSFNFYDVNDFMDAFNAGCP